MRRVLQDGLIEEMWYQNGSEGYEGAADKWTSVALTENTRSVCAAPRSPPAGSSPDTVGLQNKGRKTVHFNINNI